MKTYLTTASSSKTLVRLLHRYHVVLFVLFAIGGLSAATFFLSDAMSITDTQSQDSSATSSKPFDEDTIERVKALRSDSTPLTLPPGRTNPFN